jgi:hypothetical protein
VNRIRPNRKEVKAMTNKIFYRVLAVLFVSSAAIAQAGVMLTGVST